MIIRMISRVTYFHAGSLRFLLIDTMVKSICVLDEKISGFKGSICMYVVEQSRILLGNDSEKKIISFLFIKCYKIDDRGKRYK